MLLNVFLSRQREASRESRAKSKRSKDFVFDLNGTKVLVKAKWHNSAFLMIWGGNVLSRRTLSGSCFSRYSSIAPLVELPACHRPHGRGFTENAPPVNWRDHVLRLLKKKTAPAANVISRDQHQRMQLLPVEAMKAAATGQ